MKGDYNDNKREVSSIPKSLDGEAKVEKKKRQNTLGEIIFQDKAFIRNFKNKKLTFLKKALVLPLPLLLHPPDTLYFCVY